MTSSIIPTGWEQVKLKEIGDFSKGSSISKAELVEAGINAIRYGELYTRHHFKVKKIHSFIGDSSTRTSKKIKRGDIIFAGSGETIDEIGKSATYLSHDDCYAGGDTIIFSPKNADSLFLTYILNVGNARKELRRLGQGQSVVHLYKSDLENLSISLPPLPEQGKIVEVLETWDAYLEKLSNAIILKKKLKSGLMQVLLTGKARLTGFQEPWKRIKLGEISEIISGGTPSTKVESYWNGNISWISSSDLVADNIHYINIHRYISSEAVKKSATKIVPKQSILVVSRVGVGKIAVNTEPICTSQDFQSIINSKGYFDPYYLANLLSIEIQQFLQINQGSFIKGFLKSDLENMGLNLPSFEEQTAIANILTTADQEIEALEKKRALIEGQKKFLLNNLVTEKIRLPEFIK